MKLGTLLIRADADVSIGTGHVMRCLSLAQAWQDAGGRATFAMACTTPAVTERLQDEHIGLVRIDAVAGGEGDLEQAIGFARAEDASWIVTDGYRFGAHYQGALRKAGVRVLALDDNGGTCFEANFVLNQNFHAHEDLYPDRSANTRLLLGTEYALLRREFIPLRGYRRQIPAVARHLVVMMGGSDPNNMTSRVLDAVDRVDVPGLRVLVVVCRLVTNATNMPELIAQADLAVSAAGTICWEFCQLGLPTILLPIAENQIAAARALHAAGVAVLASEAGPAAMAQLITRLISSQAERISLSRKARTLVDGRGAERTLSALLGATPSQFPRGEV
jgi:spore coat polysaccharide biosynthesis predicted glycosyltransferase SpsG